MFSTNQCITPVLSLEEALDFQKNLNKAVLFNNRTTNLKKLEKLIEIEKFFFKDLSQYIVIDLNAKTIINVKQPKF
jgi:hypothetical protein